MYFRKKYIEKYDLQDSYNNFKIKLKIFFVNRAPGFHVHEYKHAINCLLALYLEH